MADHSFTKTGTLGGTLTAMLLTITDGEIIKTALLASVGAVVSYMVSLGLKWLVNRVRHRRMRKT